jgi:uncharacterized protein (DUF362 family)
LSLKSKVAIVRTTSRKEGVDRCVDLVGVNPFKGKAVLVKPNLNTADPFPGSTHNDTLSSIIGRVREMGARRITVGDRSGPVPTSQVFADKGLDRLCGKFGAELLNFETLPDERWLRCRPEGSHWWKGFDFARPVLEAQSVVTTCCLKTHGYGGVFTLSLKLSIGMLHRRNMKELHSSLFSMRKMIAEVNSIYRPDLVVVDCLEVFVDGGPMKGSKKRADLFVAGTDRVAVDAVGLAILKKLGSNNKIMKKKIFSQGQIARAVELGLGARGPDQIEIVSDDGEGIRYAESLRAILQEG